ncbi:MULTISPECIES: hypothetical protein [unclassified Spirosoma]|uniref:hypothetical protein n=1 Tax=unclassified Spirosoma TaxID=2621999 RepID=UPI0009636DBA|nr:MULTISPECIES: hypothetical protein [unclassified Spirosoma]MBN8822774.1 hypothetical protein [Spirosoma sp.]OJW79984.1 MAG: hypothetical protein BGO59_01850 [Spirosoma sp. 48-14]
MSTATDVSYQYIIDELNKRSIKHDIHNFNSGARIIDIWYNARFYVIQIDLEAIGFSEVTEANPGFDNSPDELFYTSEDVLAYFKYLLS